MHYERAGRAQGSDRDRGGEWRRQTGDEVHRRNQGQQPTECNQDFSPIDFHTQTNPFAFIDFPGIHAYHDVLP